MSFKYLLPLFRSFAAAFVALGIKLASVQGNSVS
ncbi:hypothetical protein SAMN04490190_0539 [Pseudomonas libanensis]|nr:hypothetical protein SAMN04490190_0539 [Pseudomonas libanensis]